VAFQILNRKRSVLSQIETETGKEVVIRGDASFTSDQIEYSCEDSRGQPVPVGSAEQNDATFSAQGAGNPSSTGPRA
jgi:hypothetical protein